MQLSKPVIWMAGDSTMQSYSEEKRPQWGWGEKLLELIEGISEEMIQITHRDDCPFETQKRYEGQKYIVDNCAMAGRSSKTFREEGRLADIEAHIQPGDYLIIQFGHNDAGKGKPERYVALEDFKDSLKSYVKVAEDHQATPVFISSIVLCPSPETTSGEAGEIGRLLPEYGKVMKSYGEEAGIVFIDVNERARKYIDALSKEEAERMYLADHVHLQESGAFVYAGFAADGLKSVL